MRLLLVDDECDLAATLKSALSPQFIVDIANSCAQAKYLVEIGEYALIVLDGWLGDGTGWELCQLWRQQHVNIPILFLSAAQATPEIIRALNTGADDYMTKPFELIELKARLQALLRRRSLVQTTQIQHGNLLLDAATYHASYRDKPVRLRRKEWQILDLLVRHPGQVVTHSMLWEHVWERDDQVNSNALEVHLSQLRRKLARHCEKPLIETVKPLGYRFVKLPIKNSRSPSLAGPLTSLAQSVDDLN